MDHVGSDHYFIGDCLDSRDAACDLGYSKTPAEKCGNREAMGGRRARRFVVAVADDLRIFFGIRYLRRLLRAACQLELAQRLVHTRSQPGSVPAEWATCIEPGTANSSAK